MYKITKEFKVSMGHRLSQHQGLCKNIHGHNYRIEVGIKSETLNKNGMVMDFTDLKNIVRGYISILDHVLMFNQNDYTIVEKLTDLLPQLKILTTPYEPTAENMCAEMYKFVKMKLPEGVEMDYITMYETDSSKATYTED